MTSKRDSRCFVLALAPDASATTIVVVFSVHKRSVIDLLYRNSQRHCAVLHAIARLCCFLTHDVQSVNAQHRPKAPHECLLCSPIHVYDSLIYCLHAFEWRYYNVIGVTMSRSKEGNSQKMSSLLRNGGHSTGDSVGTPNSRYSALRTPSPRKACGSHLIRGARMTLGVSRCVQKEHTTSCKPIYQVCGG